MKRIAILGVVCSMLLSLSSIAYSAGLYVSGSVGVAVPNDSEVTDATLPGITMNIESDMGMALGAGIGYAFTDYMRVEGEVAYQMTEFSKANLLGVDLDLTGDISSLALFLNCYFDFVNTSSFTPFIGGGVGVAKVEMNELNFPGLGLPSSSDDDTVFAYQVVAGVGYAVNDTVTIDAKYRYFGTSTPELDGSDVEYSSHNIYFGIRIYF